MHIWERLTIQMARALTWGGGPSLSDRGRLPLLNPWLLHLETELPYIVTNRLVGRGGVPWALGLCTSRMDRETLPIYFASKPRAL